MLKLITRGLVHYCQFQKKKKDWFVFKFCISFGKISYKSFKMTRWLNETFIVTADPTT